MKRTLKRKRSLLYLFSLILMSVIMAACAAQTPTQTSVPTTQATTKSTTTTQATTGAPTTTVAQDGPLTPYAETVEITVPGATSPAITYIPGESVEDNVITRKYKELLNIDYKCKWVADSTQSGEKMKLAIASNDLPDVFIADSLMLGQLIEADQIQNMKPSYDQYATPELKDTLGYADGIGFLPCTLPTGEQMGVPITNDFGDNITMMWIRADWLETLNLKAPTTFQEFVDVATAFKEKDPDQNGKDDTWGFAMDKSLGLGPIDGLAPTFGAYHSIWINKDDGLVFSDVQPEMKNTLQAFQTMYKNGLIDTEFAVKDDSKVGEDEAQGKIGIHFGQFYMTLWPLELTREQNPNARWEPYPIPLDINNTLKPQNKSIVSVWLVVRKGYNHPEAVIKSMNLWYEIYRGKYSEWFNELGSTTYASVVENFHMYALPAFFDLPMKNVLLGRDIRAVLAGTANESILSAEGKKVLASIKTGDPTGYGYKIIYENAELILDEVYKQYQYNQFNGRPTGAMTNFQASLDKLELETFTKIIMGQNIDTFDDFVSQWMAAGGQQMTQEATNWYKSVIK